MKSVVTPRQVALAIGVSEASLKRWCDKGLLPALRTAGGHRRLPISGVLQFIREHNQNLVQPEVLGLPPATGQSPATSARSGRLLRQGLEIGDEEQCRRLVLNLYLGGRSIQCICDEIIAPAFHEIGNRWDHGDVEVYEERRAVGICMRILYELRSALPPLAPSAPLAVGATFEDDPYTLPTTMAELVLRESGWRAHSYGSCHPASTLCSAIVTEKPRLMWLSVSAIHSPDRFLSQYEQLWQTAREHNTAVAVGGRALIPKIREHMEYSGYCDRLRHLVALANSLM